mgnify:CR=1 FL=1
MLYDKGEIYKAELLKKMYDMKNIPRVLDDMMFLQLIYINAKKIVFIPDSLVYYMVRKDSIINTVKKELLEPTYKSITEVTISLIFSTSSTVHK